MLETKSVAVTWYRAIVSTVRRKSRNSPASGSTVRPPVVSGHMICHSEESKVCLLFWSTTSSSPAPNQRVMKRSRLASPPCRFRAHFGMPVVPDVKKP